MRAAIEVGGADHREWFDRLASAPVRELPAGRAVGLTLMDGKGRLRAELRAAACLPDGGLLLDVPEAARAALMKVLDMYVLLRARDAARCVGVARVVARARAGRAAATLAAAGLPVPREGEALVAPGVVAALASRHFGAAGADLLLSADDAAALVERLVAAGAVRVERPALEVQRIAQGVPWWPADLGDGVIPLEAGLDADVSITKAATRGRRSWRAS